MAENYRPPATGYSAPPGGGYSNGYPYAAPPPHYNDYQQQPYQPPRYLPQPPRSTFFRCILTSIITFFVIAGIIILIVWLVFLPEVPEVSVQSVRVANFSVAADSQHVTGTWQVGLVVENPNEKLSASYSTMDMSLYYDWEFITDASHPGFNQGTKNQTVVEASISADNSYMTSWSVSNLNWERVKGDVPFRIRISAWVQFRSGWWQTRSRLLKVWCENLRVGLSNGNGTASLVGGERNCNISV